MKKIWKQHISNQLDKGYRLACEMSYLVEKIFLSIIDYKGGPLTKKKLEIFFRVGNIEIFEINIGENFSKFRNKYFEILIFKFRNKNFEILKFRNFRKISKF
jgi:hypothetical protein